MAYNHGREDRKWRIWKEAEEKVLRECGVDEAVIEQIRIEDIESKQEFISQIMTSKSPVRSCEDVDEATLSYAQTGGKPEGAVIVWKR